MLPPFAVAIAKGHWVDIVALVPTTKVSQGWPAVIRQSLRYAGKKLKPEAATMDFTNPAVLHAHSEHIRSWFQELKSAGDDDDEQHESVTQNMAVWVRHLDAAASVLRTMSMDMEPHIECMEFGWGMPDMLIGHMTLSKKHICESIQHSPHHCSDLICTHTHLLY